MCIYPEISRVPGLLSRHSWDTPWRETAWRESGKGSESSLREWSRIKKEGARWVRQATWSWSLVKLESDSGLIDSRSCFEFSRVIWRAWGMRRLPSDRSICSSSSSSPATSPGSASLPICGEDLYARTRAMTHVLVILGRRSLKRRSNSPIGDPECRSATSYRPSLSAICQTPPDISMSRCDSCLAFQRGNHVVASVFNLIGPRWKTRREQNEKKCQDEVEKKKL